MASHLDKLWSAEQLWLTARNSCSVTVYLTQLPSIASNSTQWACPCRHPSLDWERPRFPFPKRRSIKEMVYPRRDCWAWSSEPEPISAAQTAVIIWQPQKTPSCPFSWCVGYFFTASILPSVASPLLSPPCAPSNCSGPPPGCTSLVSTSIQFLLIFSVLRPPNVWGYLQTSHYIIMIMSSI